ncbi:signal peptide peptidase SppA [Pistricoccus aurantiacus]|uniref:signal peptide peptidase SppA n=1 Tax=Pistricoccus aurantiacus TaxID=1883414 RepID=UPI003624B258
MQDDDKRWTQGPMVDSEDDKASRQKQRGQDGDEGDAETLRERQRLAQFDMMDRWIDGVLVEQRRSRRWKLFFRFVTILLILLGLSLSFYGIYSLGQPVVPSGRHLGVVEVKGVIDNEAPASAQRVIEGLDRAWKSDATPAVVVHINSPGGSPVQSQRIYAEIMRLRESGDKPIIAVIEDIGASGAYYIAAAADEIVAAPASLVGSIGVIFASFGLEDAIDRLGVERRVFTAGDNKAFLDPFSGISDEQRAFWQKVLETTHGQFIQDVKAGRGERLGDDDQLFSGLVWTGEQALELGLIDSLDSLDGVARRYLDEPRIKDYTPRLDPFERISRGLGRVAFQWFGIPEASSPLRYQMP